MAKRLALTASLLLATACSGNGNGNDNNNNPDGGPHAGPAVKVSGRVLDRAERNPTPIAGATVEIVGASPAISTVTGADGAYSLQVPSETVAFVRATANGFAPAQRGLVVPAAGAAVDLTPISTANVGLIATLLGLTVDSTRGLVVASFAGTNKVGGFGATLSAGHGPPFAFSSSKVPVASTTTQAGGDAALVFPNTVAGTTTVTATAPAGGSCRPAQAIADWRVDAGVFTFVDFDCQAPLGAPVAVSGRVLGSTAPLAGASVEVVGAAPAHSTTTDAQGAYTLQIAANAQVFLRATATGYATVQTGLLVPAGGLTGLDFEPPASAEVAAVASALGIAVDGAKGLVAVRFETPGRPGGYGATLSAAHGSSFTFAANGTPTASATTLAGGDGTLVFPNTVAGTTTVAAVPPAGASCEPATPIRDWRVDAGVVTMVGFRCAGEASAVLHGRVSGDSGGSSLPLAGATVEVVGASPANSTVTDAAGEFSLAVMPDATLFVRATASGYQPQQVGLKVPADGARADLSLVPSSEVAQVATALGLTLDAAKGIVVVRFDGVDGVAGFGAALGAAHGASFTFDSARTPTASTTTLAGGDATLVFPNTAAGTTTVSVSPPAGYACALFDLEKGIAGWRVDGGVMTMVAWRCAASGTTVALTGRVTHEESNVAGAAVEVVGGSGSATTAADGTFTLNVVSGSTVFVRATKSGFVPIQEGLVVPGSGATLHINLISTTDVASVTGAVGVALESSKGVLALQFEGAATTGGYGATLSASHGTVFAMGAGGPVLSATTTAGEKQELVFANVAAGTTTVTPTPPGGHACTPHQAITHWRVDPGVFSRVRLDCN